MENTGYFTVRKISLFIAERNRQYIQTHAYERIHTDPHKQDRK